MSRDDYLNRLVDLPTDLFAHNEQVMSWQTSVADSLSNTGWGGRVADLLHAAQNGETSKVSMSISIAGTSAFLRSGGQETLPFAVGLSGAATIKGFGSESNPYENGYASGGSYKNPIYQDNRLGSRLETLDKLVRLSRENLMTQTYADTVNNVRSLTDVVGQATLAAEATGVDFDTHFLNPHFPNTGTSLGDQLKMVAKLIAGHEALGNRRQIFFVSVEGYDIHANHLPSHVQVVAFTASDFNRNFKMNGSDGTDHAWGGHSMVMGGPVQGGELFGHFPSLKTGDDEGSIDIDAATETGRWIPDVSVDQFSAVMARWLGVESSAMEEIFPNLYRFDDPLTSTTPNLGFLDGGEMIRSGRAVMQGV